MDSSSLQVTVLLFAYLREEAGPDQLTLRLPTGARLSDVWTELVRQFPRLEGQEKSLAWAVNHTYVKPDHPLHDGDTVAALPPISGGTYGGETRLDG